MDLQSTASFSSCSLLTWNAIVAFSEQCSKTCPWSVATLLVVSSAL